MRKTVLLLAMCLALVGGATAAWVLWRGSDAPPPPQIEHFSDVDPLVQRLVDRTLAEIDRAPRRAELRARLAMIYHANGLFTEAEAAYRQAVAMDPHQPKWWYCLAVLLDTDLSRASAAFDAIERAIELEPGYAPLWWRRGQWRLEAGMIDEAEADFRHAITLDAANPAARVGLARVHLSRGQYEPAVALLEPIARSEFAEIGYMHQLLGTAYRGLGRMDEARLELARSEGREWTWEDQWWREMMQYRTGFAAAIKKADALVFEGRVNDAINELEELRRQRPDDHLILGKLGEIYLTAKQHDRAIRTLRAAIAANERYVPTHVHLATAYRQSGDLNRALQHADRAIELNDTNGYAHKERALIFNAASNPAAAAEAMQQAVRYGLTGADDMLNLAILQKNAGQAALAEETVRQAIEKHPGVPDMWVLLVQVQAGAGRLNEALRTATHAVSQFPDHADLRTLQSELRRAGAR